MTKSNTIEYVVEIGDERHVGTVIGKRGTKVKVQWYTGLTKMYPKKKVRAATDSEIASSAKLWANIERLAAAKETK
jgi:hypothetical protein